MQVAQVAGQVEVDDLPPPVLQRLVAERPAVEDQIDPTRSIALADQVAALPDGDARPGAGGFQRGALVVGEQPLMLQPGDQAVCGRR